GPGGPGGPGGPRPMQPQPFAPNAGAFNAGPGAGPGYGPGPGFGPGPGPGYGPGPGPGPMPMPFAPPMGHGPGPMPMPAPMAPPYLSAQGARTGRPIEPWKDSLRLMMFVWGGVLLVVFVTPLTIEPLAFNWDTVLNVAGKAKLPPLILAAVGLLSI